MPIPTLPELSTLSFSAAAVCMTKLLPLAPINTLEFDPVLPVVLSSKPIYAPASVDIVCMPTFVAPDAICSL